MKVLSVKDENKKIKSISQVKNGALVLRWSRLTPIRAHPFNCFPV